MPGDHIVHIITSIRGDDGKLISFDVTYDNEADADALISVLERAVPKNELVRVKDDKRLEQSTWLAAGQVIEVRRRHRHAAQR